MSDEYLGGCEAASKRFGVEWDCCRSCHDDDDDGYSGLCMRFATDGYYDVCCKMTTVEPKP